MRPVSLSLNGFASFRDAAELDFTGADHFALVGPTGAGKSTILDAITFALYGTAPRWGSTNAIADALAPTANRCTVSLVFDLGAERYQIAREVRRSGTSIQQKNVSLVRFTDPTATSADDTAVVLAGEVRELKPAVESLLGLSYADFCQCVVLPQGQFAKFLTANPTDRQRILLALLGAARYDRLARRAGEIATAAQQETELLNRQLGGLADATAEAESRAATAVTLAEELQTELDRVRPAIGEEADRRAQAERELADLQQLRELLADVRPPAGIAAQQEEATSAVRERHRTAAEHRAALSAQAQANESARLGPDRSALEQLRDQHTEHARLVADQPQRERDVDARGRELADRATDLTTTQALLATQESRVTSQREAVHTSATRLARITDDLERLNRVAAPVGLADLADRASSLRDRTDAATARLAAAHDAEAAARQTQSTTLPSTVLTAAEAELTGIAETEARLATARARELTLLAAVGRADGLVASAEERQRAAHQEWDRARTASAAAGLRPQLLLGHDCPVCAQPVAVLPPPLEDPESGLAREQFELADHQLATAREGRDRARRDSEHHDRTLADLADRLDAARGRLERLVPELAAAADPATHLADLNRTATEAAAALTAAQQATRDAETVLEQIGAERARLATEHRAVRDRLTGALGTLADLAPRVTVPDDDAGLRAAWDTFLAWQDDQRQILTGALAEATTRHRAEQDRLSSAVAACDAAREAAETAQQARTIAVVAHRDAVGARDRAAARTADLAGVLTGRPSADEIPALLAESDRLAAAATAAARTSEDARRCATHAEQVAIRLEQQLSAARREFGVVRDRLAVLQPPPADPGDLAAAWTSLAAWADATAERLTADIDTTEGIRAEAGRRHAQLMAGLVARFDEADRAALTAEADRAALTAEGQPDLTGLDRLVTQRLTQHRHALGRVQQQIQQASSLRERIAAAEERRQVAEELRSWLRSDKFPRWLASTALGSLVVGASATLRRLSNGQFDLSHDGGEFYVVDHHDADSTRSVRTLSGGETFQASLALALALSDHLAGMAGTVKLESIFLDEGFGTLDPESLETVAETLETLSQEDRTVGVITHVAALAERVPVRFQVRRDHRTSRVTREEW